jgi:cell division protein FtsI/penicillin-binding protein 2
LRIRVNHKDTRHPSSIQYTIDASLQNATAAVLDHYRPDYGVFVAIDPESGHLLAIASHQREGTPEHNLALRGGYPAASVFKIITAAAAVELGKVHADTVLPFNGKETSLSRKNILHHKKNQWTRHFTVKKSFAKSVNTVFARMGIELVTREHLLAYAGRFGFNQSLGSDFIHDNSTFQLASDDPWLTAKTAAGYTRQTTLNPIHGAVIAATIANGGYRVRPTLVDALIEDHGIILYEAPPTTRLRVLTSKTTDQLQKMMETTVRIGSAKSSFKNFFRGNYSEVHVGGKTGTLTGLDPPGRYDWFVGYAHRGQKKLAFASLCINREYWHVKSAYVARKAIEHYFSIDPS